MMVALTLIGVVTAILHPVAWTDEEMRLAVAAPVALGTLVFLAGRGPASANASLALGPLAFTPLEVALALALGSVAVAALFWFAGRIGFGPLASPPAADDPARFLAPPTPAPEGWLRPGWLLGLPVVYAAICLVACRWASMSISYIPWALIGGHQLDHGLAGRQRGPDASRPDGPDVSLPQRPDSAHAASSPWWAWPLNLKPVWFYQEGLALGTSAALYDAGSLVIWWLGIPALAFVSIMAFKRRSLALTLIAVGFAAQWVPWARIDRAAFQYHYYTALPFVVMALAYLMAEIWHGASKRTWQLARLAAAVAIMGPALMWLFHRPLCWIVGVDTVNPGSAACPAVIPTAVITMRTLALAVVVIGGVMLLVRQFLELDEADGSRDTDRWRSFAPLAVTGLGVAIGLVIAAFLPDTAVLTLSNISVEPVALVALLPARLPGDPDRRLARCPPVRHRLRRRRGELVRDPLPEHLGAAAAVRGRRRVPGHPADLPVRVPVPGEHGRSQHRDPAADPDVRRADRGHRRDLSRGRLLHLVLAAGGGRSHR